MNAHILLPRDTHEGPALVGYNWFLIFVSTIVVACRCYIRAFRAHVFGWDDACILVALVLAILDGAFAVLYTHYGVGTPIDYLTDYQIVQALKWLVVGVLMSYLNVFFVRLSVGLFILRMLGRAYPKLRTVLYSLISINVAITIMIASVVSLFCGPSRRNIWGTSRCLSDSVVENFNRGFAGTSAAIDVLYVIIPISIVWKLQMDSKVRRNLAGLLMLGLGICVCAIGKAISVNETSQDLTLSNIPSAYWAVTEGNLGIVVASLPTLRQFALTTRQDYINLKRSLQLARLRRSTRPTEEPSTVDMVIHVDTDVGVRRPSQAHSQNTEEYYILSVEPSTKLTQV